MHTVKIGFLDQHHPIVARLLPQLQKRFCVHVHILDNVSDGKQNCAVQGMTSSINSTTISRLKPEDSSSPA